MQIAHVKIMDVLGISEMEFEAGQWTEFSGKNGERKTSALDAIKSVFKGGHDATLLRAGAAKGETVLVLDDGTVLRQRITAAGTDVFYTGPDGKKVSNPASAIKGLVDQLSVNPVDFLRAKKNRVNVLLDSLPLQVDDARLREIVGPDVKLPTVTNAFEKIESLRKSVYDDRTGTNRAIKSKETTVTQLTATLPMDERGAPVAGDDPTADLNARMLAIDTDRDAEMERIRVKLDGFRKDRDDNIEAARTSCASIISGFREEITALEKQITDIQTSTNEAVSAATTSFSEIESRAESQRVIKSTEFTNQRADATRELEAFQERVESIGRFAQTRKTIAMMEEEANDLREDAARQDGQIIALDAYKSEILGSLPIEGLEVRDGEIFRHNVAFDRLNTAQQVDIAFDIAKLRAGDLGVVCIDGVESLDTEHYERFTERALESGIQMFVTRVADHALEINVRNAA